METRYYASVTLAAPQDGPEEAWDRLDRSVQVDYANAIGSALKCRDQRNEERASSLDAKGLRIYEGHEPADVSLLEEFAKRGQGGLVCFQDIGGGDQ